MKKKKLIFAINKAFEPYYKSGLTNTAEQVKKNLIKEINKAYLIK